MGGKEEEEGPDICCTCARFFPLFGGNSNLIGKLTDSAIAMGVVLKWLLFSEFFSQLFH